MKETSRCIGSEIDLMATAVRDSLVFISFHRDVQHSRIWSPVQSKR